MNRRMTLSCAYIFVGVVLTVCGIAQILDNFWSGMGGGLIGVGAVQLYKHLRYRRDAAYKEAVDTARSDERNGFIANKAMSWAGYQFVMIASIGTIVFQIAGNRDLSLFCGGATCLLLVLYWVSYLFVSKKY